MTSLNENIFYFFNSFAGQSPWLDSFIVFVANGLPWILIIFTVFYFLFFRKSVKKFTTISFVVGLTAVVVQFLKWQIFLHPRPFVALPDVTKLINISGFDSFPSGHAAIFMALATIIYIYNRRLGMIFGILTIFIGLTRVMAGVHYPFDILTGFVVGFVMAIISYQLLIYLSRAIRNFIS